MYEQIDFHFRYQPESASPYALLLKYLQPKRRHEKRSKTSSPDVCAEFPKERMILWALSAFWYPSACKALGGFTEVELKQKAKNAIYQLLQQINYLIQMFGLDPQEFTFPTQPSELISREQVSDRLNTGTTVETARVSVSTKSTALATTPNNEVEELVESSTSGLALARSEDDETLDEAFDG